MPSASPSSNKGRSKSSGADRGTVWITAISAALAWVGIGLSVYGAFTETKPAATDPAAESAPIEVAAEGQ